MPRKIDVDWTLDTIEDEILFTRSALEADPDARDLAALTDDWLGLVDEVRVRDRAARMAEASASAHRAVANGRLDDACRQFAKRLGLETDTGSARWKRFFGKPVGAWLKQRLAGQVTAVRGWLTITGDAVLDASREPLTQWSDASHAALERTAASAQVRGAARVAREELAIDLTRERDGLHAVLVARANERGLGRDWPARFHRAPTRTAPSDGPAVDGGDPPA